MGCRAGFRLGGAWAWLTCACKPRNMPPLCMQACACKPRNMPPVCMQACACKPRNMPPRTSCCLSEDVRRVLACPMPSLGVLAASVCLRKPAAPWAAHAAMTGAPPPCSPSWPLARLRHRCSSTAAQRPWALRHSSSCVCTTRACELQPAGPAHHNPLPPPQQSVPPPPCSATRCLTT